jgi:hypothetical protein
MKKTIGIIDSFIDEWHANNFPSWIAASSFADEFEISCAWEVAPHPERRPLEAWCRDLKIAPARSIEEVVNKSDCVMVLAPNNSELHEELADYALKSGKPVYVDKTFAPDLAAAKRMFALAAKHGSPLMSCSALRYARTVSDFPAPGKGEFACSLGGGQRFKFYAVHQVEMLVCILGTGARRVMVEANGEAFAVSVKYEDSRMGKVNYHPAAKFQLAAQAGNAFFQSEEITDPFFEKMTDSILGFFFSRQSEVPMAQTCEIIAILEAIANGCGNLDKWIEVPR